MANPIDKDQIEIATKLSALMERMSKMAERTEQAYNSQLATVEKLSQVFEQINVSDAVHELQLVTKALRDVAANTKTIGKVSEDTFTSLTQKAQLTTDQAKMLKNGILSVTRSTNDLNNVSLNKLKKILNDSDFVAKTFYKDIHKIEKSLGKKLPMSFAVLIASVVGLAQGFKNLYAITKSTVGFLGTMAETIGSISLSIVSIPFKMFNGLVDIADKAPQWTELAQAIEDLRKEFGDLGRETPKTIRGMARELKGFSDTGLGAWNVFGNLAKRIQDFNKLAQAMGPSFQLFVKEFQQNGGAILAYQKGLGLSDEMMKSLAERSKTAGSTISKTLKDMTKYSLDFGKSFGIDAKLISRDMGKASADVKHFGQLSVKELGMASVYARKLGVELDKVVGVLDMFETFDSAAEASAKLAQSFGVQIDAFQMMETQNPAEQIEMLRKQMRAAGQDSSNYSRQQLKLLSQTTGLDEATAKLVFSQKNQGMSYSQIQKKAAETEKKTLTQAEAMEKLASSIERLVFAMQPGGGFIDHFIRGFMRGSQHTREFWGLINDVKKDLHIFEMTGRQVGKMFIEMFPGLSDSLKALRNMFAPAKFRQLANGIKNEFEKLFLDLQYGLTPDFMEGMRKLFFNFFDMNAPEGKKLLSSMKTTFLAITKIIAAGITWASQKLAEGIKTLAELIRDPSAFLQKTRAAGGETANFVIDALMPIKDALKGAWKVLLPAAKDLFSTVFNKVMLYLKSDEFKSIIKPFVKPAMIGLAAVLFGPIAMTAVTALGTAMLLKSVKKIFGDNGLKKKLQDATKDKVGGLFTNMAQKPGVVGKLGSAGKVGMNFASKFAAPLAAAFAVSKGLENYREKLLEEFSYTEATIGAGTAGIIDSLTFGLLPKGFIEVLATGASMMFSGIGSIFESLVPGLGDGIMTSFAGIFDIFSGLGKILTGLWNGSWDEVWVGLKETGKGLTISLLGIGETIISAFGGLVKFVISGASRFLNLISGPGRKLLEWMGLIKPGSDNAYRELEQTLNEGINGMLRSYKSNTKFLVDELTADSKKNAPKIEKAIKEVASVSPAQIKTDIKDTQSKALQKASVTYDSYAKFMTSVKASANDINKKSIASTVSTVQAMVKSANDLNTALADGNINNVNVTAKLKKVAASAGLGAKGEYKIKNKDVVLNVTFNVSMDVGEVEKIMITRQKSVIRDRINYLGEGNPDLNNESSSYMIKSGNVTPSLMNGGKG